MSSIYKQFLYQTASEEDVKMIDNNAIIAQKLEKLREEQKRDEFIPGIQPVEILDEEALEEVAVTREELEEKRENILQEAKEEASSILQKAENDAAEIIREAEEERIQVVKSASEEGFQKGYQDGVLRAEEELREQKKSMQEEKEEWMRRLEKERRDMEPQLVETILDVISHVTHVLADEKKDLILAVINSALEELEINHNFVIRVCPEDAVFLRENKEKIEIASPESEVEIVEDMTMKKGQCMIDTEVGVFDCSLDIQLRELMKDIKILACTGKNE